MSTENTRPLNSLPQLPMTPRWAPSTPHAVRALQQRSEGRRKSANITRPDSARNILRQLAKITAIQTNGSPSNPPAKPSTPAPKAHVFSPFISLDEEDIENGEVLERPDFTLPIELVEDDGDVQVVPTEQELPGGDDYNFKSIDSATQNVRPPTSVRSERIRRRSRIYASLLPGEGDDEGPDEADLTVQSIEYGRRAISEGPGWDRYPRSSFGSIRMSEFGLEESRFGKEPQREQSLILDDQYEDMIVNVDEATELDEGYTKSCNSTHLMANISSGVTEALMSERGDDGIFMTDRACIDDENTFRLDISQDRASSAGPYLADEADDRHGLKAITDPQPSESSQKPTDASPQSPTSTTRQLTDIEVAATSRAPRRKKMKLTHKGNTVPVLPSSLVKRTAMYSMMRTGQKRPTISRESLAALEQATEWFFEQVGEDLEAYSDHAKRRKRIDEADVLTLMRRQRVIGGGRTVEGLAQEFLPDEVLLDFNIQDEA